jgi:ElaB/YqjD/DUF883 family membrane-anchored ribosome-binding protein
VAQEWKPVAPSRETEEIKHEIERTRIEMSETLDEIQDRLRPDHLLQQARDGVTQAAAGKVKHIMSTARDTASNLGSRARGAGTYVADCATEYPIATAVTVGALTWWMLRGRSRGSDEWLGAVDGNWDDAEAINVGDNRTVRDRVGEYASTARETVSEYASSARDTVGAYASTARDTASEYADSARESARRASMRVRTAASSAGTNVDEWVRANPMAAGAIALAIGAAIGLSAPRTELEDVSLGETRDRALERGRQIAKNLKQNVTEKVTTAAENLVGNSLTSPALPPDPMGRA